MNSYFIFSSLYSWAFKLYPASCTKDSGAVTPLCACEHSFDGVPASVIVRLKHSHAFRILRGGATYTAQGCGKVRFYAQSVVTQALLVSPASGPARTWELFIFQPCWTSRTLKVILPEPTGIPCPLHTILGGRVGSLDLNPHNVLQSWYHFPLCRQGN